MVNYPNGFARADLVTPANPNAQPIVFVIKVKLCPTQPGNWDSKFSFNITLTGEVLLSIAAFEVSV